MAAIGNSLLTDKPVDVGSRIASSTASLVCSIDGGEVIAGSVVVLSLRVGSGGEGTGRAASGADGGAWGCSMTVAASSDFGGESPSGAGFEGIMGTLVGTAGGLAGRT